MVRCKCGDGHYHRSDKRGNAHDRLYCASRHPSSKSRAKAARNLPRPVASCTEPSFRKDHLELAVEKLFTEAVTVPFLIEVMEDAGKADKKSPAKRRNIDAEIAKLVKAFKKGYREYSFGRASEEDWAELRADIENQRRELMAERPAEVVPFADLDALAKEVAEVFAGYPFLRFAQMQVLIREAIREIHIQDAEIMVVKICGGFLSGMMAAAGAKSGRRSRSSPYRPRSFAAR